MDQILNTNVAVSKSQIPPGKPPTYDRDIQGYFGRKLTAQERANFDKTYDEIDDPDFDWANATEEHENAFSVKLWPHRARPDRGCDEQVQDVYFALLDERGKTDPAYANASENYARQRIIYRVAGIEEDDGVDYGSLELTPDVEREIASLRASHLEWQGIRMLMAEQAASLVPSQNGGSPPPGENGEAPGNHARDPLDFTSAPPEEAMVRINTRFFVLVTTGTIYCQDDADKLSALGKEKFAVALAGRTVRTTDAEGETKQRPAADYWVNSRKRREVSGVQYCPNGIGLKSGHANLFTGWGSVQPRAGDCSVMTDHVYEILADRNDAKANFLFDWSADILLNPGRKPGVVPVLRGDEGSGKSVYAGVTRRILGAKNVLTTSDADRILGRFAAVANKILVVGEEVLFAGNKSQNDKLKHLITGDTIQVEVKFGDPLEIESCHRLMLLSNHEHVLNVGANARRIVMYEVPSTKVGDDKYFDPLQDMAKGRDDATVGMFMRFLLDRDLSSFRPWKSQRALAGDTALVKQKQLSLPPPLLWLREVVDVIDGQQAQPTGYNTATSWVKHYSWSDGGLLSAWPPAFPRVEAVNAFRNWAKETKPYGASEFTSSPERFWTEIHKVIPLAQTQRKVHSVRMVTIDLADLESNFQKYLEGKPV